MTQEEKREYDRKRRSTPEFKARRNAALKLRRQQDPAYREKVARDMRERRASDREYAARQSDWHKRRTVRERTLAWKYGLTVPQLREIVAPGKCGICGTTAPKSKKPWHIDHDHATGVVREMLCHRCNAGLGFFGDDERRLTAAIEYLRRHKARAA